MIKNPRTFLPVLAMAVTLLASCDVASVGWGPVSSSYDGQTRVRGSGVWVNDSSVQAVNRISYRDTAPLDGNTVYVKTQVRWWTYNPSQDAVTWLGGTTKSTPETSSSSYIERSVAWSLNADGSRARAEPEVCAQMGWPVPDSCASGGVPTFNY